MANKQAPREKKTDLISEVSDVEDQHNHTGDQQPTQKNEGRRTPTSRSDRESHIGGNNQSQSRRGATPGSSGGGR
jgi:hypothetical protein